MPACPVPRYRGPTTDCIRATPSSAWRIGLGWPPGGQATTAIYRLRAGWRKCAPRDLSRRQRQNHRRRNQHQLANPASFRREAASGRCTSPDNPGLTAETLGMENPIGASFTTPAQSRRYAMVDIRTFGGFICPKCGGPTACRDSRRTKSGTVRRRKHCVECGHRITTYEFEMSAYRAMIASLKDLVSQAYGIVRSVGAVDGPEN